MKTYEQITADVLARRDAYLAQREQKRRAAKKYAAASLLVLAAFIAAAVLYRSGLLRADPPVSVSGPDHDATVSASSTGSSAGTDPQTGRTENGTGTQEPDTETAEPTKKTESVSPTKREEPAAVPKEPGTAAGEEEITRKPIADTTARQTQPSSTAVNPDNRSPTRPAKPPETTAQTAKPTEKQTEKNEHPQTEAPTKGNNSASADPFIDPSEQEPATAPPTTAQEEHYNNGICVIYNGSLYYAMDVPAAAIPDGAKTLAEKDAYLYEDTQLLDAEIKELLRSAANYAGAAPGELMGLSGNPGHTASAEPEDTTDADEADAEGTLTRITLLSLPGSPTSSRIGVTAEGIDGMFTLEFYAKTDELTEDLTQEELP